jgi:hypothetical protein
MRNKTIKSTSLFVLVFLFCINLNAQRWKSERHSVIFGLGPSHFFGDLGGGSRDASHFFSVRDLDFKTTKFVFSANYRFRILETVALRAGFTFANLAASDANSGALGRRLRNLSFFSPIYQGDLIGEYYFVKERPNPRYSFTTLHSIKNFSVYAFTGFSAFSFNPQAEYEGLVYALQPLGTEGQGIGSNPPKYSLFAFGFPLGLGVKYRFTHKIDLGLELSNTYTTTDYLDDASGAYFDNAQIRNNYGKEAAELADRHMDVDGNQLPPYVSGTPRRGNPKYNDAYFFTKFTLTYKIKPDRRGLPKF